MQPLIKRKSIFVPSNYSVMRCFVLVIFIFFACLHGAAQLVYKNTVSLQFFSLEDDGFRLIGGSKAFVLNCLESDLGFTEAVESELSDPGTGKLYFVTDYVWKDIRKKSWSTEPCVLKLSCSVDHPDFNLYLDSVNCFQVTVTGQSGKKLGNLKSASRKAILEYLQEKLFRNVAAVNSRNGVNVRKQPALDAAIIHKFADGEKVILRDKTDIEEIFPMEGKKVKSLWRCVYLPSGQKGYIPELYLLPWHALHPIRVSESDFMSVNDHKTGNTQFFTTYPMLEQSEGELVPNPDYLANLKTKQNENFTIEEVQLADFIPKKIASPYFLDTSFADKPCARNSGGNYLPEKFYLKINGGKDTIFILEEAAEYPESREFIGRIAGLNQYVFKAFAFGAYYTFYDMTTGATDIYSFTGIPYLTADAKYAVSFTVSSDPEIMEMPNVGVLSISKMGKHFEVESTITFTFKAWLPDESPNSAFWVSDRDLIIRVRPEACYYYPRESGKILTHDEEFKYLKITLPQ